MHDHVLSFHYHQMDCCFFDGWAAKFDNLYLNREKMGQLVMILQLAKVKYFNEKPSVSPALYNEVDGHDPNNYSISVLTPTKKEITPKEFFQNAERKMIGSIRDSDKGETPKFGQLYIFDPANEVQNIINVVRYRYAGRKLATGDQNVKIRLLGRRSHDGRQYNLPTANEVATLIVGDFDSMPDERDIIVHENSEFKMHDPCDPEHRSCSCMVENKCSKNFPKKFNDATFIDESGYAIYKRSDNGRTVMKQGAELDGRYVVPYNLTLLKRYQAHINVEWCNQFGSIKYLFKYINKGPDRVTAVVEDEETDEIKDYFDCRYLSSCEAEWRIFKFDIHHRFPVVERLPFHLPNQQSIVFDPSESIDYKLEKKSTNTSKFLAWMEINKTDIEAKKLLYVEFPEHYVWNKTNKIWTKRKQGNR
ncbi:hypothetical protein Tco_0115684 [Tanacetum coccineum]